jgi:DNA-binding Lrp family transcriptional regulator
MAETMVPVGEAAVRIGISREALIRRVQQGECKGGIIGGRWLLPASEVERMAARQTAQTA